MVLAGKVFKLVSPLSLVEITRTVENFQTEETFDEEGQKFTLLTEITHLAPQEGMVTGLFSRDYVVRVFHRGKTVAVPRTSEVTFCFAEDGDRVLLTVVERKNLANSIANQLSKLLYGRMGEVAEARISPEVLREFHLKNPEDTKVTFFDNVDIPNIDKLSLYGPDLVGTPLFEDYFKRGDLWYIVLRSRVFGYVVGITRDASVVVFNEGDKTKYLDYIKKEVFPLIL
jgi:hypothetical protein